MIDYTKLTTEQFQDHCTALYAEQERRAKIASIPEDIKRMSNDFETLGGDKADLVIKVNEPKDAPVDLSIDTPLEAVK